MGDSDFRVSWARLYCILLWTLIRAVISTGLGGCPVYPNLPNFDINRIVGRWYEVESSFYVMELTTSCTRLDVSLNARGHLLIAVHTDNRWTGVPSTTFGVGVPSHDGSSVFRYKRNNRMPYVIGRLLPGAGQYNVLFTDYERFAIVWSCSSVGLAHSDRMWVLGRTRSLQASVRAMIYSILEELHMDPDRLMLTKQNNCSYEHVDATSHIDALDLHSFI